MSRVQMRYFMKWRYGCQMAIARFLDRMCLALWASGLWLRSATLQNLIPSFPWIAPPRPPPWRNPRKGRNQILLSGNTDVRSLVEGGKNGIRSFGLTVVVVWSSGES